MHVGDVTQEGHVEDALVGGAVVAHEPCAVHAEDHGEVLQAHVVDYLVVGALQEGGVDAHQRAHALAGEAGREGDGVLLADADIEEAVGIGLLEEHCARAVRHGRRDGDDAGILFAQGNAGLAEYAGEARGRALAGQEHARLGIEVAHAVVVGGVLFRGREALALLGVHVEQHRPVLHGGGHGQVVAQSGNVVAVHRADVGEAEGLEKHARREEGLEAPLAALGVGGEVVADARNGAQEGEHVLAGLAEPAPGEVPREEAGKGAHVGGNGHLVVVEHDDELLAQVAGQVEALEGFARSQGAVADDGDDAVVLPFQIPGRGHAEGGGDGGGGVAHAEEVVGALGKAREARQPSPAAQGAELAVPAGEDLVGIGLVPHVPDELVPVEVEFRKQGQGELDGAQRGGEMAAVFRAHGNDAPAQLAGKALQFRVGEPAHVAGALDGFKKGCTVHDSAILPASP